MGSLLWLLLLRLTGEHHWAHSMDHAWSKSNVIISGHLCLSSSSFCPCDHEPSGFTSLEVFLASLLLSYLIHVRQYHHAYNISKSVLGGSESLGRGLGRKGMSVSESCLELLLRPSKEAQPLIPLNTSLESLPGRWWPSVY